MRALTLVDAGALDESDIGGVVAVHDQS